MLVAALAMYPLAGLREPYDALWAALRDRLETAGIRDIPESLEWERDLHQTWADPDLLVGNTCGWPLVTELEGRVAVIGSFDMDVPFADAGHYRSVLVAAKPIPFAEWRSRPGTVVAVNTLDSLSGWVSLAHEWGEIPDGPLVTGGHLHSMRAVASGAAHVASIDAVSLEHVVRSEPMTGGLHIVGHGPRVPTLPLVCAARHAGLVPVLRRALADTVSDPALRDVVAALRIRGFVPLDRSAFDHLPSLLPRPSH